MLRSVHFVLLSAVTGTLEIPTKEIALGVQMPVLSIGTGGQESSQCATIVDSWLGLGGRGIDTAAIYDDQSVVAQSIASSKFNRSDVFITTKIAGCPPANLTRAAVEQDLGALNTDYIDLLLIHFPKGGCSATWAVLEEYHAKGTLKAIGVSNFKRSNLDALMKTAKITPSVNQIQHSVLAHDDDTIQACVGHNITVMAYSPLGRNSTAFWSNPTLKSIGAKYGVGSAQVALKWILQHGHILAFQSTSRKHQAEDADLFRFTLGEQDMTLLDSLPGNVSSSTLTV